jgi:hypothetical protein
VKLDKTSTLIFYTTILSRLVPLFSPKIDQRRWCYKTSVFLHPEEVLEGERVRALAMIVSRDGYLQAVCTECEFMGNDCELEGLLVVDQCELKSVMFASRSG